MKASMFVLCLLCFLTAAGRQVRAQGRNEIAVSLGAGSLQTSPGGGATAVFSFSYRLHITRHVSAEGALDSFTYKFPTGAPGNSYGYRDGYLGAEAAVCYYFLSDREAGRLQPFVAAGIGKTTTDFTEIAAHPYYRLGIGASYFITEKYGVRVELRDEIVKSLYNAGNPNGNLPSIRFGVVYRF